MDHWTLSVNSFGDDCYVGLYQNERVFQVWNVGATCANPFMRLLPLKKRVLWAVRKAVKVVHRFERDHLSEALLNRMAQRKFEEAVINVRR